MPWTQEQCERWSKNASAELLRPVDGMDEHAERVPAQPFGVVRGVEYDCNDGGPSFGRGKAGVLVAPLDPGNTEAVVGRADHARDIDRDLDSPDLREGIIRAGIVVERDRALVGDEFICSEPVLADDDRVRRDRADVLDEASEMPGDLG